MELDSRLQVSAETIHTLADNGLIGPEAHAAALHHLGKIPSASGWRRALDAALLIIGVGLLLAGVFFFFAYNWQAFPKLGKLATIEVMIVAAAAVAYWRGLSDSVGRVALSAAAILIGALLAVYGQIYQTGADSYQLFLWWAILSLGWVWISRFAPLWLGWIALAEFAIGAMWVEFADDQFVPLIALLFAINVALLIYWERNFMLGKSAYQSRYWPRVVLTAAMGLVFFPTIAYILNDFAEAGEPLMPLLVLLYLLYSAGLLFVYRNLIRDLLPLTVAGLGLIVSSVIFVGQMFNFDNASIFLLLGLLVIGEATLLVRWLQQVTAGWDEAALAKLADGGTA